MSFFFKSTSSSSLSSAESIPTPPGAWIDDDDNVPASAADTQSPPISVPNSPAGSAKSSGSSASKKRSRVDTGSEEIDIPGGKRKKTEEANSLRGGRRTSGRSRKTPERFGPQSPKGEVGKQAADQGKKHAHLLTNPKSRLLKTDLFHMLLKKDAWTDLANGEKTEILSLLPKNFTNVKLAKNLDADAAARPKEFDINFNLFRTDVAKFEEDLFNGFLTRTWQAAAEQAVRERAEGSFDDWKDEQAETWWGQNC